ncbi:MAG: phage baseplate protein [Nitrosomonas sp.]|nr:MAG: phage baseplate protein [Nitrosomonas sp.]
MRNLSAAELLTVWERTHGQLPMHQAMEVLAAAFPEHTFEQLAQLSIGQRDGLLLLLRERLFGTKLNSMAVCPQCQQRVELVFNTSDVKTQSHRIEADDTENTVMSLTMEGYEVNFRLPNSFDLMSIAACANTAQAQKQLLNQCIQSVSTASKNDAEPGNLGGNFQLPASLQEAIVKRMAESDPQANTQLALTCPDCNHNWSAAFDIVTYLMEEIHRWAKHMLREIHALARAYGWREADILAMAPTRRRAYLELLGLG